VNQDVLSSILERHADTVGALLPVLHAVQGAFGHVPPESVARIAESLRVSRAEVHGLITFFHDLRLEPGGRTRLQVCRAEACQSVGGRDLEAAARQLTGLDFGETSADGSITLDAVYCLGNCACGPSVCIDETVHGAVDATRLAALLESARSDVSVVNLGIATAPAGGATIRVFVPSDTTAGAVGADTVAQTLLRAAASRGFALDLVRNGSRGAAWLEPLLEIERDGQRIGFANVTAADVESLLDGGFAATHPRCVGPVESLPWLLRQQRTTFRRIGRTDPLSLADYRHEGGLVALQHALTLSQQQIVDALKASGLRGRGGAAFPSGIKWQTVLDTPSAQKFVVCNAEEGDSGTFADRLVVEADP
jgi:formate dehydrogenase iron-sulfur subunit